MATGASAAGVSLYSTEAALDQARSICVLRHWFPGGQHCGKDASLGGMVTCDLMNHVPKFLTPACEVVDAAWQMQGGPERAAEAERKATADDDGFVEAVASQNTHAK